MKTKNYPNWVDDYAKARYKSSAYSSPSTWGPVNIFSLPKFFEDDFVNQLYQVIEILEKKKVDKTTIAQSFTTSSAIRTGISFMLVDYSWTKKKDKVKFRKIMEFLVEALQKRMQEDLFVIEKNLGHSKQQVNQILQQLPWISADLGISRQISHLTLSLASLVFALFGDFYPQDANEVYGPYDASAKFGPGSILIVRHFPDLKPTDLWPNTQAFKYSDIKIYLIYQDVKYQMAFIGMHNITQGDLIQGLKSYVVEVDGKYLSSQNMIGELTNYFSQLALQQSQILENMDLEELKKKALEWEGYQFKGLFELAGVDWRPDAKILKKVIGEKVARRLESTKIPTWEQFCKSKHNDYAALKDLYS